jgi:hypothetical protein
MFVGLATLILTSCADIVNIPPGYEAKILTPTGWQKGVITAGQVDIGRNDNEGRGNQLVLMEATTVTVKESFTQKVNDQTKEAEDHRVRTKDGTPLNVDIYVQIAVPIEPEVVDAAFSSITPKETDKSRIFQISVQDIYERFAQMTVRGKVREIFAGYKDADDIMQNYAKVNAEIELMAHEVFKKSGAPCTLVSAQLSNVKEDGEILESKNKLVAARNEAEAIYRNINGMLYQNSRLQLVIHLFFRMVEKNQSPQYR